VGDNMQLTKWTEKTIKKMKWYDMSLLKLCVFFWTVFLITAWADFRNLIFSIQWYWYLIIAIVLMLPLLKKMFLDK
jgi:hypothetical protein